MIKILKITYVLEIIFCAASVILVFISVSGEETNIPLLITSSIGAVGFCILMLLTDRAIRNYVPIPKKEKKPYIEYEEPDPEKVMEEFEQKKAKNQDNNRNYM